MIDYTKILIKDTALAKYLISNLDSLFDTYYTTTTTSVDTETINVYAHYKGLKFKITQSGVIILDGSLHKAMNEGSHNHNDFSYTSLLNVVADLCNRFKIDPNKALVQNLEIGVNLNTIFDPTDFTDRCIFLFSGAGISKPLPIVKNGSSGLDKGIRFELTEYCIKIYNKGKQYGQSKNILRVEYKTLKMRAIKDAGIETLLDLCDLTKLNYLVDNYLLIKYGGIMVDEVVNADELSKLEQKHYNARLNYPDFWKGVSRTQRQRNRSYIDKLYKKYAITDLKDIARDLISQKSRYLLTETSETEQLLQTIKNTNCVRFHRYINMWNCTQLAA